LWYLVKLTLYPTLLSIRNTTTPLLLAWSTAKKGFDTALV
jgi:hypothetical protein